MVRDIGIRQADGRSTDVDKFDEMDRAECASAPLPTGFVGRLTHEKLRYTSKALVRSVAKMTFE